MLCHMKIVLSVVLLVTSSLAIPVYSEIKHEKRSIALSDPANLLVKRAEKSSEESSAESSEESFTSNLDLKPEKPQNKSSIPENKAEISLPLGKPPTSNEFKGRSLDLTKPWKEENSIIPQVRIGYPINGPETYIIRVPEPYVIRVPHIITIKDPHFVNGYFGDTSISSGSFHPFGEYPGITQTFSSSDNIFDISQLYPSNPIEISQGFEGFSPITGVSDIQGFPGFGDGFQGFGDGIQGFGDGFQGFEILQPEPIPTLGLSDEKIDYESDSIIVDAKFKKTIGEEKTLIKDETRVDGKEKMSKSTESHVKES